MSGNRRGGDHGKDPLKLFQVFRLLEIGVKQPDPLLPVRMVDDLNQILILWLLQALDISCRGIIQVFCEFPLILLNIFKHLLIRDLP